MVVFVDDFIGFGVEVGDYFIVVDEVEVVFV